MTLVVGRIPPPTDDAVVRAIRGVWSIRMSITVRDAEPLARRAYTAFILLRPEMPVEGLFYASHCFHIVCPGVGPDADPSITHTFASVLPLALPLRLSATRPINGEEVAPLTEQELHDGYGLPRTADEVERDIALRLPRTFPVLDIDAGNHETTIVRVHRQLTEEEAAALRAISERLGLVVPVRTEVVVQASGPATQAVDGVPDESLWNPLDQGSIRLRRETLPAALRAAAERDEDEWRTAMDRSTTAECNRLWPDTRGASCVVRTVFPPGDIRPLLSLYPTVFLEAPRNDNLAETLRSLGVTRKELRTLVQRGNVRLLCPQPIGRYDTQWLTELLEESPANIVLTRRLLHASIVDQQRRLPWFDLQVSSYERRALARALHFADPGTDQQFAGVRRALLRSLTEHWVHAPRFRSGMAALASLTGGLARFATEVIKELRDKDMSIEIGTVAQQVEWAGALGADLVPYSGEKYSEENAAGLLLALASGVDKNRPAVASREFRVACDLLTLSGDVDVIELAAHWGAGDAAKVRELVRGIVRPGRSEEEIAELTDLWNREVAAYERSPDRIKAYNLSAIALSGLAASSGLLPEVIPTLMLFLPLVVPYLQTNLGERWASDTQLGGQIHDWMQGKFSDVVPGAVLLARARKRIGTMKLPRPNRPPNDRDLIAHTISSSKT